MLTDPAPDANPSLGEADPRVDVVVVGAGPAGLAAAAALLEDLDLTVAVIDAGLAPGGQYWRQPGPATAPDGLSPAQLRPLHHDLSVYDRLSGALHAYRRAGRLELLSGHEVWSVVPDAGRFAVHSVRRGELGSERVTSRLARAVVVTTGAYDRVLPFPGWDLPGVMTAGALQALLKGNDVLAGRRVAVAGTGPFLLPVAAGLVQNGAEVVGVFEANAPTRWLRHLGAVAANAAKLGEGARYAAVLARHRVSVRVRTMVVAAHGADRVEAVTTMRLDRHGLVVDGSERRHAVDAVGVGWGFAPQLDLALTLGCEVVASADGTPVVRVDGDQMTSRPGVFAAGETCGVGGAALAVAEGRVAGLGVRRHLADPREGGPARDPEAGAEVTRLRRFAAAMHAAHPVPAGWASPLTPTTTLCRCEEVSYEAVESAIQRHGCSDARQLKQLTRVGMGWCQGRVCGYAADLVTQGRPGGPTERLVAAPVTLRALADSDM